MEYALKKVMIVGMARSGQAAAKLLLSLGANVICYDAKPAAHFDLTHLHGCTFVLGENPEPYMEQSDILVLSPGVPTDSPLIRSAMQKKKYIISEIELGWQHAKAQFVCIGGTNGKTTTTALTGEIFKNAGKTTYVLGNIGTPICEYALSTQSGDIVVAETAALQLEKIDRFRPSAAALLNITPDHLDRFKTMEYYAHCKFRLFENQQKNDIAVLNLDDNFLAKRAGVLKGRVLWFSKSREVPEGAYLSEGHLIFRYDGKQAVICAEDELRIPGAHNLENALAAICLAGSMGIPVDVIRHTLNEFPGVEHRIEYVRTVNEVEFINDSKGTNPDATIKAIQAMKKPTVLILGGFDKKGEFDALFQAFTDKITAIVLLGETKEKLHEAARRADFRNVIVSKSFEDAVITAYHAAQKGGAVLLSPACASWDMFRDFEHRGSRFKEIVKAI